MSYPPDDSFYVLANVETNSFNDRSYTADIHTETGVKVGWVVTDENDDAKPSFINEREEASFNGWCDSLSMSEVLEILFHNYKGSL